MLRKALRMLPFSGMFWWSISFATCRRLVWVAMSHYQSTLDALYVYAVPWSEFLIVPVYLHYPQLRANDLHSIGGIYKGWVSGSGS